MSRLSEQSFECLEAPLNLADTAQHYLPLAPAEDDRALAKMLGICMILGMVLWAAALKGSFILFKVLFGPF